MADGLDAYRAKRDFEDTPEPAGDRRCTGSRSAVRGAGALGARDALGPAPRARGHARLVGDPEGHPGRPEAQQPRGPDRGPPARVPRLPRRDPGRQLRRRDDADLRPRHVRAAQVARQGGDGHLPRRARARQVRAVQDRRQELDDPPDGPAGGPGPGADAGADRADARPASGRCRATTTTGRTRSSGTACARSATPRAAGCGWRAATATTSRRATRSCASSGARSARTRRCSTARSSRSRDGRPSFQRLQRRMHLTSESQVRRLSQSEPVVYMIFDLLWLDGHSLMGETYEARRATAGRARPLRARPGRRPPHHVGDGEAMLAASRAQGLEGIVAKRLDCPYIPGRRSQGWVKVKNKRTADVVVGGWLPGEGGRSGPARRARGRLLRGRASCATPAAPAPASPSPSSSACRRCWRRSRATTARSPARSRRS